MSAKNKRKLWFSVGHGAHFAEKQLSFLKNKEFHIDASKQIYKMTILIIKMLLFTKQNKEKFQIFG